mmetsp:Transcript_19910/g.25645  ORF Transcript_19910/g.25645 Transcript_19910/m.25645 type:complete len:82 (-) Transcript_19910:264-509(-)
MSLMDDRSTHRHHVSHTTILSLQTSARKEDPRYRVALKIRVTQEEEEARVSSASLDSKSNSNKKNCRGRSIASCRLVGANG